MPRHEKSPRHKTPETRENLSSRRKRNRAIAGIFALALAIGGANQVIENSDAKASSADENYSVSAPSQNEAER